MLLLAILPKSGLLSSDAQPVRHYRPQLQITEEDGSPDGRPRQLYFDNNTLVDNADGSFTVYPASGSGVIASFIPYIGANANVDLGAYDITTTGDITLGDDSWVGIGAASARITFDATGGQSIDIANSSAFTITNGDISILTDDKKIYFGAVQDYSIEWDGSDAVHTISAGDFVVDGPSGAYRTGFKIDTDASTFGPTLVGYTTRDANNRIFFTGSFTAADNQPIIFGGGSDYRMRYDSGDTRFEFWSTDIDGIGTGDNVFFVNDGTDDVIFNGNIGVEEIGEFNGLTVDGQVSDSVSANFAEDLDLYSKFPTGNVVMGGLLWGLTMNTETFGIVAWDGRAVSQGGVAKQHIGYFLWTDETALYGFSFEQRFTAHARTGVQNGPFTQGEHVEQQTTGATGWYTRVDASDNIYIFQEDGSADFQAEGVAGNYTITGDDSGAFI